MPQAATISPMSFTASPLTGISSMATRALITDLTAAWRARGGGEANILAIGGVDAAKRVAAGEAFDIVVLAADAIDKLVAGGSVVAGSRVDLVRSGVAVAVRVGAARPDLSSVESVRRAALAAPSIGWSTGPSGVALAKLFAAWGIAEAIAPRVVTAPPGVPVGSLVAKGEVALGFQQLSELMNLEGIEVVGPLPPSIQIVTTFSAALCAAGTRREAARDLIAFMASPEVTSIKQRNGMEACP
jgi:molybdate transport system substrate-binding protein